jgi:hypothetical protein
MGTVSYINDLNTFFYYEQVQFLAILFACNLTVIVDKKKLALLHCTASKCSKRQDTACRLTPLKMYLYFAHISIKKVRWQTNVNAKKKKKLNPLSCSDATMTSICHLAIKLEKKQKQHWNETDCIWSILKE